MAGRKRGGKLRGALGLMVLAAAAVLIYTIWTLYSASGAPQYDQYTVARGDLSTRKSFSATLSVRNSEVLSNTEGSTILRDLYVESGQEVKKGDSLLALGTGKILTAGISGTVNEIRFNKGDALWPNIRLIEVDDLVHLQVQLQVDEYDIMGVAVGQKCTVTVVPMGTTYETEIAHVNRVSASNGRVAYYPVTCYLDNDGTLLPGMTVSVSMPNEEALDVLYLPVAALTYNEENEPGVLKREGQDMQWQAVTLGLSDGMKVAVTGLQEGDIVYAARAGEEDDTFSLQKLLRQWFGTRVVINEERGQNQGRNRGSAGQNPGTPEGMPEMGQDGALPEMRQGAETDGAKGEMPRASEEEGARESESSGETDSAREETAKSDQTAPQSTRGGDRKGSDGESKDRAERTEDSE